MTVVALRNLGHEVVDIRGTPDEGMSDTELWMRSQNESRLVITTDKGFSKQRYEHHHGILIIRLKNPNRVKIHQLVDVCL